MSLYRQGRVWYVYFVHSGRRIRKSTGTEDKKQAQEYHDKLKAALWRQDRLGESPPSSATWENAAKIWLTDKPRGNEDKYRLKWLTKQFSGIPLESLTVDSMENVLALKSSSAGSYNRYVTIISAILKRACKRGLMKSAPTLQRKKMPKGRTRWLTQEEWKTLQTHLPGYLLGPARFAIATGLREDNILELEWSQVDLERKVAWIHPDQTKAGNAISVPLSDEAIKVLKDQVGLSNIWVFPSPKTGGPLFRGSDSRWYKAVREAGLKGFRWHDLRHTWASWHIQNGTPLAVLQQLGGWSDIKMVMRYSHLAPDHIADYANNARPKSANNAKPKRAA